MSEQTPETPAPDAPAATEEQPAEPTQAPTAEDSPEESTSTESAWDPERAREKIRKINSENKTLRERASQAEAQAATVPDLQQQTETLASENLRLRVGYELGLPINLASRLQGSTREELVADAESLVALVAPAAKPTPATGRPVADLRPGATPTDVPAEPLPDTYPADFLSRRVRDQRSG